MLVGLQEGCVARSRMLLRTRGCLGFLSPEKLSTSVSRETLRPKLTRLALRRDDCQERQRAVVHVVCEHRVQGCFFHGLCECIQKCPATRLPRSEMNNIGVGITSSIPLWSLYQCTTIPQNPVLIIKAPMVGWTARPRS